MKCFAIKKSLVTFLLIFVSNHLSAQNAERFFPKQDLMTIGSYYYPEQWPKENWERDIKKMAELGFDFTHFGEFAWAFIEPEEGKFDFAWLDEAVRLSHRKAESYHVHFHSYSACMACTKTS